jgi:hypothetical protein
VRSSGVRGRCEEPIPGVSGMSSTGKGRLEAAALGETKIARALKSKGGRGGGSLEVWWRPSGEGGRASL